MRNCLCMWRRSTRSWLCCVCVICIGAQCGHRKHLGCDMRRGIILLLVCGLCCFEGRVSAVGACQVELRGGQEVFEDEGARNGEDKM